MELKEKLKAKKRSNKTIGKKSLYVAYMHYDRSVFRRPPLSPAKYKCV